MVAGAHRKAVAGNLADVAHQPESAFAIINEAVARHDGIILQVHGFAAAAHDLTYGDVTLSSGDSTDQGDTPRIASALHTLGFNVCLYDGLTGACSDLGATSNVEGEAARRVGAEFTHVEVADHVRKSEAQRTTLMGAIVDAMLAAR